MTRLSPLVQEFWETGRADDCPVYDMHGHMGAYKSIYMPFAQPKAMVQRMQRANVRRLVFSHHTALHSPELGNSRSIEAVREFPDYLRAYYVINPNFTDILHKDMDNYQRNGDVFIGFKFHPASHQTPLTDDRYSNALAHADRNALPVLVHTWGGNPLCGVGEVRTTAEKYPNALLILGHSLHGAWDEAASIAEEFPNVYLELCAVVDERKGILELFVSKAGSEKVLFGTDFPWFNHHYYIGAVLAADITDEDRRNIFYRNAQKILGEEK